MMNKMGSWNMLLDYGCKSISDYLYHYELATLKCLMAEYDQNNASRYSHIPYTGHVDAMWTSNH
jgi:hypothetical protein